MNSESGGEIDKIFEKFRRADGEVLVFSGMKKVYLIVRNETV